MERTNKQKEHPEVKEIKNICEVSPKTKITEGVCNKIQDSTSNRKPVEKK